MTTGNSRRRLRLFAFTLVLIGARFVTNQEPLRALPLQCETEVCTSTSVACDSECGIGWTLTTCSDYLSVYYGNGQCDEASWNTCNYECGSSVSGSQECLDWGVPSTCEDYGNWGPRCGNNLCDSEETPTNCEEDCGSEPSDPVEVVEAVELELNTYEPQDVRTLCLILSGLGIGYEWDCPSSDIWAYNDMSSKACSTKASVIQDLKNQAQTAKYYWHIAISQGRWSEANDLWEDYEDAMDRVEQQEAIPCYIFTT